MTGLAEQISDESPKVGGQKKRIWQIMSMLDPDDQRALREALDDHSVPAVSIKRALAKRDIFIGATTISNYRAGHYGSL